MKQYKNRGITVIVGDNLNIALKKFKKKVDDSGILIEVLNRQSYEKPTSVRKRKAGAARARWLKKLSAESLPKKMF
jgi:small subunit ribosomal protein S21